LTIYAKRWSEAARYAKKHYIKVVVED